MTNKTELSALIARSLQTDEPPAYVSTTEVRLLSEPLHKPQYWTGREWAVTSYGIEKCDGKYAIAKARIWDEDEGYGWVEHMEEKEGVDLPDFIEALRLARHHWPRR